MEAGDKSATGSVNLFLERLFPLSVGDYAFAATPLSFARSSATRSGDHVLQPWNAETSPASQASRRPGALRSQSGRISLDTARRSRQRSSKLGLPQNQ